MTVASADARAAMRLWHLERKDDTFWGATREFWIAAKTDQEARELAHDTDEEDGCATWLDRRRSRCSEEGKADPRRKVGIISRYQFPDIADRLAQLDGLAEENTELRVQIGLLARADSSTPREDVDRSDPKIGQL